MPTEDINSVVSGLGLSQDSFNIPAMIAGMVFGLIGFSAFMRARKTKEPKALIISITLMVYPFFVSNPIATWLIGLGLTAALFIFRD
ncbi:MAG: hypothetical protein HQL16_01435 [Candidatus Omnitrophica bacterium]|nr:hypothetical protein [Candidatus Omnitrophota bacterium]